MRNAPSWAIALLSLAIPAAVTAEQVPSYKVPAVARALKGRFHPSAGGRKTLTDHQALQRLRAGTPVYVGLETGTLRRGKLPRGWDMVFRGHPGSKSSYKRVVHKKFQVRQRAKVSSVDELLKLNETDRLTYHDTRAALSSTEHRVAGALRRFAGGVHGSFRITACETANCGPAHKVKVRGPKWFSRNPGLYAPDQRVGGFLGLGKQPRRLSVLEATNRIVSGQPVLVRDKTSASIVSSPDQVATFDQLR